MKKVFLALIVAGSLIACDNSANNNSDGKDSLDSIAAEKKDLIDSSAEERKAIIDSTTEAKKEALDKLDSANRRQDTAVKN